MNEVQTVSGIVSSVGFPIAACLFLGFFVYFLIKRSDEKIEKLNEQHRSDIKQARAEYAEQIDKIMQQHKAESDEMRDSINRIAEGLPDLRDMMKQIIRQATLKPPDDTWNE